MLTNETGSLLVQINRTRIAAAGMDRSQYERVTSTLDSLGQWPPTFVQAGEEHLVLDRAARSEGRLVCGAQA